MRLNPTIFTSALLDTMAACAGCGTTSDLVDDGKAVSEVEISPNIETLSNGSTMQFSVSVIYADGMTKDVSADSNTMWKTSDAEIATVSKGGLVTAVDVGLVSVTADYKGEKDDEDFAVTP